MASEELVTEQFQLLGIEINDAVLRKCVHLCEEYDIDAETFIEQWMAFSLNNLKDAQPTIDNLDLLVRKEFSKRAANSHNVPAKDTTRPITGTSLPVYGASVSAQPENEVLSNYMTTTPKRVKVEIQSAPTPQNELQPASYSPNISHSAKYSTRTNQGSVVHSFGDHELLDSFSNPSELLNLNVSQMPNEDGEIYSKSMFGFELLHEKASTFDNHIRYLSQCIARKAALANITSVRHKSQAEISVGGRIECDADARLNPKSVMLQGTWEDSLSQAVPVDLDNVKQYALFPGQVVVMKGSNPRGDKLLANEVIHDAVQPLTDLEADMINTLNGTMSMLVAAGPYTTSDNLTYEPLKDLITYIGTHRPHIVILTGPFMDSEHTKLKDNTMAETYKAFFEKLVDSLAEVNSMSPDTKIYIVSSCQDAHHVNVYPTPPYSARRRANAHIHFLPDPCTLNISGVVVGVTSTDVLMHLSQEEISLGVGGDKLSRLASHVLSQRTYYPLWPPGGATGLAVDAALWAAHAQLPCTPHVLVLPSNFRYFVKEVNGCVVVNPEHLTKGTGGGTFARLRVRTHDRNTSIAAQIVRI